MSERLPNGWARTTLGQLTAPTRPRCSPVDRPHLPFIGMEHVEAHTMKLLGTVSAAEMKSSAVHFQPGDILYGRLRPYLNKVYRPDFEGLCSAEFIVLPTRYLSARWLAYRLNASDFVAFGSQLNTGDRPRVDFDQLSPYETLLPPALEQDRIADEIEKQLTRLENAVNALKRVQANLKRYRASVLKAACEGRLVPTEAELARKEGRSYESGEQLLARILKERRAKWEADQLAEIVSVGKKPKDDKWKAKYPEPARPNVRDLPALPEGWAWASIDALGDRCSETVLTGPFGTSMGRGDFIEKGVPVITIGCLTEAGIDLAKACHVRPEKASELQRYRLREGDLLFSRMASVGRAGKVGRDLEGAVINYHLMRLRLNAGAVDSDYYLAYVRGAATVRNYVLEINHGATRDGINTEQLLNMPVALPPFEEQRRIAPELDRVLSRTHSSEAALEYSLNRCRRLRAAVLRRAFCGKLVPQDPNDEPASVLLERIRAERAALAEKARHSDGRKSRRTAMVHNKAQAESKGR